MDDEIDYETLPSSSSLSSHLLAGACAGVMEHTIMYPFDCVKGFRGSLRGIGAMVGGAGPAHAAYFACYEYIKSSLADISLGSRHVAPIIGGVCATLLHDAVMTPADAVKQRLQIFNSPYHSSLDCLRRVCLNEGPLVLYRAYFTQLSMSVPYQAVHFVCYEASQDFLNPSRSYQPWTHIVAGGLAGGFAAAFTNPLDVCKTTLNTQDRCVFSNPPNPPSAASAGPPSTPSNAQPTRSVHREIRGLLDSVRVVYSIDGLHGFTRGMGARVMSAVPGTAISWSIYEYFKWLLKPTSGAPPTDLPPRDSPQKCFVCGTSVLYATGETKGGMTCAASSPLTLGNGHEPLGSTAVRED